MKKFFTLIACALITLCASADDAKLLKTVKATYQDYSADYPNYADADWGMVSGARFNVEFYDNDSIVVKNWMNQGVDLGISYDENGALKYVNGNTSWAYADSSIWFGICTGSYYAGYSWFDKSGLFLEITYGNSWYNYYLSFRNVQRSGCIYRLGIGDYIKGTVYGEEWSDGSEVYTIPTWYGKGSKNLQFTLSSKGEVEITNNVYSTSEGYTYYNTGIDEVNYIAGWPGYNTVGAYADTDWTTLSAITNDTEHCMIYIAGYYGPYDKDGNKVTDPNGYKYWTFDTDMTEYDKYIAGIATVTAETSSSPVSKSIENGQLVIAKNGKKFNAAGAQIK